MRHNRRGRKLRRTTAHRKALRKNLAMALFEHGSITTTLPKAKEVRSFCEKIVTLSKNKTLHNYRQVLTRLQVGAPSKFSDETVPRHKRVTAKLFDEIGPLMKDRPGGYTRILRLPKRRLGDGAQLVLFELVEKPESEEEVVETAEAEE